MVLFCAPTFQLLCRAEKKALFELLDDNATFVAQRKSRRRDQVRNNIIYRVTGRKESLRRPIFEGEKSIENRLRKVQSMLKRSTSFCIF